jgi:two-component system, cell cycle response regulator
VTTDAMEQPGLHFAAAPRMDSVLIAEDDVVFRHILQTWLQKWDYRVTAMDNGLDAWAALQAKDAPQMVLLDWLMPGMDGLELCRRIRSDAASPYRYVLLLTSKNEKEDLLAGLEAGADDYLTKPFDVDELRARIRAGKRILELQKALLQSRDALQFQAAHDPLTVLWNRCAILDILGRELQRRIRSQSNLGIMMADVDHFKTINDSYGHLVGDVVLQEVAQRLAGTVRCYDSVGRYGGEEFLILVPGCQGDDLVASAERLRRCIADRPVTTVAGPITVTISLGLVAAEDGQTSEALLRAADTALYNAKSGGRNRVAMATVAHVKEVPEQNLKAGRK